MVAPGRMAKAKRRESLKGWQQIAAFLGQPTSVAQRWAKSGMPVTDGGRRVQASPEELNCWLGPEVSEPVPIATESADLASELKRGLSFVRKHTPARKKKGTRPKRYELSSFLHRKSRFHPSLLSLGIMRHVGVTHGRQFTGGILAGVSMQACAVGNDLSFLVGQQLRSEFFDLFRGDVQRSGEVGLAVAFRRKRLDDLDWVFSVQLGF
jgi:hypothetical protein